MIPKISVIIPVYNVEQFLPRCVDSVINQTYKNLEIILVDDGSLDGSSILCDNYAKSDNRIKVVHKLNGGLSSARNVGLVVASGEYIGFLDSDDWIDHDTLEYCYNLLVSNKANVVQFDLEMVSDIDIKIFQPKEYVKIFEKKSILEYYLDSSTRNSGGYSVCRCLFDAKLAKKYQFREGKINEDIDYKYKVLRDCTRFVNTNQKKYYYWQGNESLSKGGLKRKDFDLRDSAEVLYEMTSKERYGKIAFLGRVKKARTAFSFLCKIAYYGVSDPSIDKNILVKDLIREHRDNLGILLKAPLPISRKVLAIMFAFNFKMTEFLIHCVK